MVVSGTLAWSNSATEEGGVVYCDECSVFGTQLDSVRAAQCETDGLPSFESVAIQDTVAGKYPSELKSLRQSYGGRLSTVLVANEAGVNGGAVFCKGCTVVAVRDAILDGNTAK